jgi:hypothetical protein
MWFKLAQMENMLTFIDRLKHAITLRERELGARILKKDLAEAADVSSSAVTYWFKGVEGGGTSELKAGSILGLSRYLKVRVEWLRDNEGPMRVSESGQAPSKPQESRPEANLSLEARRLIKLIEGADRSGSVSQNVLSAFATIFGSAAAAPPAAKNMTRARSGARLEKLVLRSQPAKRRKKAAP